MGILNVAVVSHDHLKETMIKWIEENKYLFDLLNVFSTKTTGERIEERTGMSVTKVKSGQHGGDQQIGSMIAEGKIDMLIFFYDPLTSQPHDADVKALLRLATLIDIPVATNKSTADCLLSKVKAKAYEAGILQNRRG